MLPAKLFMGKKRRVLLGITLVAFLASAAIHERNSRPTTMPSAPLFTGNRDPGNRYFAIDFFLQPGMPNGYRKWILKKWLGSIPLFRKTKSTTTSLKSDSDDGYYSFGDRLSDMERVALLEYLKTV